MFFSAFTLGCKLNQLETEAIADSFCRNGFSFLPWDSLKRNQNDSGILVINTCTVTSMAEQKARRVIRKAMREHPKSCLIVTGCYAQMEKTAISKLDENSSGRLFVIPGEAKDRLLDLGRFLSGAAAVGNPDSLRGLIASWLSSDANNKTTINGAFCFVPEKFFSHSRAFLKIQDGCDRNCAYCRVSLARGKSRSLAANEVLKQLQALEQRGIAEAVLTGVNICQYRDLEKSLPELLEFLLNGTGKIRLRLSSIEPEPQPGLFNDAFLRVLADKRIRPHFHISLQSGSPAILAKMGRPYSPADIERTVALLRGIRHDPFLACDIIAGFPGETECEFEKTYTLMEKLSFAWIHAFPYSKRPGTTAYNFAGDVSSKDVARRVELLTSLAQKGRLDYIQRWKGMEVEAVVEAGEKLPKGMVQAVTENYLKACVDYGEEKIPAQGSLIRCRIAEIAETGSYDALACYVRPVNLTGTVQTYTL
jgi:threonylcarbamoyladenosine tRNA methylthiotransferase MtaB